MLDKIKVFGLTGSAILLQIIEFTSPLLTFALLVYSLLFARRKYINEKNKKDD